MNEALKDALAKIEKARQTVSDLCDGRIRWTMSVPARPDSDPDLIIADALQSAKEALSALSAQQDARDAEFYRICRDRLSSEEVAALFFMKDVAEMERCLAALAAGKEKQ